MKLENLQMREALGNAEFYKLSGALNGVSVDPALFGEFCKNYKAPHLAGDSSLQNGVGRSRRLVYALSTTKTVILKVFIVNILVLHESVYTL